MIRNKLIFGLMLLGIIFASSCYANFYSDAMKIKAKTNKVEQQRLDNLYISKVQVKKVSSYAKKPILALTKNWILIVFFSSGCPHCKVFVPVVSKFINDYGFEYRDYTLDGMPLGNFKNPIPASPKLIHAFFGLNPIKYPAVFLVNKNDLTGIPISIGELTYGELQSRFIQVAQIIQGKKV